MRGERQAGELSLNLSTLQHADTCKGKAQCLHISKLDIKLILSLAQREENGYTCCFYLGSRTLCSHEGGKPCARANHRSGSWRDDSLSCHVSVIRCYCAIANYRWLDVFPSSLLFGASPYPDLKGRSMFRQKEAAANCSAQSPPFSSGDHSRPALL